MKPKEFGTKKKCIMCGKTFYTLDEYDSLCENCTGM